MDSKLELMKEIAEAHSARFFAHNTWLALLSQRYIYTHTMNEENQLLITTDEPVEFEKKDFRRITNRLRGIMRICLKILKKNLKDVNM